ncbi:MAG: hypothetical protein A3A28_05220 [Candidatus Sungbacteria bacterium RIFCSPLOWO2_01_FULL_47_32]|uniref:Type II secretion system protein GspG C-terminal domain-containing protein n=1 Tax=Candidatus Sungbacteria bacterium RIFCSPHIGHO2_01_FULL_47_32 TaxID=1802264 RepID=A0A1G2K386_9BACT|nr:MAG: General secretion pathway protein G [Parcubacteria group bacterium GW2011_GWA2_47_10]OGZ93876.1 MAG: hypothetical protein A2633_05160 [Candidatus Sungbacteria bacterium RIFCSPHIGHO2_01_FULL_47_32]OGZ99128.1 MAG: hypothetical protein A3D57_05210 [Candidatus Sungbacteria bacterium RIFCSPHIGHO2_02_FULL_46_12]OHA06004.1 MAG: hypothetical protein A3A28_05220 [Candidatus Sungbacteria bacterium RIFCSPLOWO2_01_FULL_47_32]
MTSYFFGISRKEGFTMVELLVVIAIIGVLATLIIITFTDSRIKARDAQRKLDFQEIRKAIELYRTDNGGLPPLSGSCGGGVCTSNSGLNWIPGLAPTFIPAVSVDPVNNTTWRYKYTQSNDDYELDAALEHFSNNRDELNDGGDCATRYEVGSDTGLNLLPCAS